MVQKKWIPAIYTAMLFSSIVSIAYANSSWHWFTDKPFTLLPWAILMTLCLVSFVICYTNRITQRLKAIAVIVMGNVVSFLAPYAFIGLVPEIYIEHLRFGERIHHYVSKLPVYTVGIFFLVLTLAVETPIVYGVLKKQVTDKRRLLISIIAVNCFTTLVVAIMERVLYKGSW